jgi:DNA polymerase III subunit alpha
LNALYRPGPIQGGMIDDFIERKHGRRKIEYELPELKEILQETLGVIVYQEQVMQAANKLAGYSLGEADLLRRAMGKKNAEEMAKQRERFVQGAMQRGFPPKKIEKIFDLMAQFAGYGFNKSHSAAYALLAYHTAYLKTHHPLDFMAALLTSVTGSTDDVVKYINECREMGIAVEPPDINVSDANFTPHGQAIRFGLAAVKNVGGNGIESIVAGRKKLGRNFKSFYEFCGEVDLRLLNKRVLESLIKSGAMDGFGRRAQLMQALGTRNRGSTGCLAYLPMKPRSRRATRFPTRPTGMNTRGWRRKRKSSDFLLLGIRWKSTKKSLLTWARSQRKILPA